MVRSLSHPDVNSICKRIAGPDRAAQPTRSRSAIHRAFPLLITFVLLVGTNAVAAATHVHLTWTASSTAGIRQYSVWRSTTSGNGNCNAHGLAGGTPCPYVEIATGIACCAYDDYAVGAGTTYFYVVADYAPAPAPAAASLKMSSGNCPGAPQCVKEVKLLTGGTGYDYGIGWPNNAGLVISGGSPVAGAVAPRCTNYNGSAYVGSMQSCDKMCWKGAHSCSGYLGAGYTSTPMIQALTEPLDMGRMYPAVAGSGLKPAGFSDEVSIRFQPGSP